MTGLLRRPGGRRTALLALGAVAVLAVLVLATRGRLLAPANLRALALDAAPVLVAAAGMALVMAAGSIDLSVGAQVAMATALASSVGRTGGGGTAALMVATVLFAGAAMGALNGALVVLLRLPSLLVTLTTMLIFRHGMRWWARDADLVGAPPFVAGSGVGGPGARWLLVPALAVVVFAAFAWAARRTPSRRVLPAPAPPVGPRAPADDAETADGGAAPAARLGAFVALGLLAAVAALLGLFATPRLSLESAGAGFALEVIAAVLLGAWLAPGPGALFAGVATAVLLLAALAAALTTLGVAPGWTQAALGALLIAAAVRHRRAPERAGVAA